MRTRAQKIKVWFLIRFLPKLGKYFHSFSGKKIPNLNPLYSVPSALFTIILATFVSLLLLVFLSWVTFNHFEEMGKRTNDVAHSYQIRFLNKELIKTLVDIETGQRGFLLSHQEHFLVPYQKGLDNIKQFQTDLRELVRDNDVQLKRLDSLDIFIKQRLIFIKGNIARAQENIPIDLKTLNLGKGYMDKIRATSERFDQQEKGYLDVRIELQKSADHNMSLYLLGLCGLALAFLAVFFRLLYVELSRRIGFQTELENKLSELERTNAELEQFAYVASHDLQEPLRKIRAFSERLQVRHAPQLNEDAQNSLVKISQSAMRMQNLINDLLAFSKATNRREENFEKVDLNNVLKNVREELSERIAQKNARIINQPLPEVLGVRSQFEQLFTNLISNSMKYCHEGVTPMVTIDYQQVAGGEIPNAGDLQSENIYHRITFIDNGIGFEPQYAEKIFVIFQRLHSRNEFEGTGIGLSLCRRIVTNHNGYILAEPRQGESGAIFHVYLPK